MKKTTGRQAKPNSTRRAKVHPPGDVRDVLTDLAGIPGPPGREDEVRRRVLRRITKHVDHVDTSPVGALHAIIGGGSQRRLMIAAHMDEVGVVVSHVHASGLARFGLLGRKDPASLIGHRVRFSNGTTGVIRPQPLSEGAVGSIDSLFLDFGTTGRAQSLITEGDIGCFVNGPTRVGERVVSANLGGRSGVAALIRTIEALRRPAAELQFVFSVQGEFGGDGGVTSASTLDPQRAVVVAPAPADDFPGRPRHTIRLGSGPIVAIRHASTASEPRLAETIMSLAKKRKISYQIATLEDDLPGSAIPMTNLGTRTVWICIPCRGLRTTAEMVDPKDVEATARLLTALAQSREDSR